MTIECRNTEGIIKCDPVPKRELREGNWFCVCSRCKASYIVGRPKCGECGGSGMGETLDTGTVIVGTRELRDSLGSAG